MRTAAPSLLPIMRSATQGDMLALLYLNPDDAFSLTDIARAIGSNVKTVHAEANRLVEGGFASEKRVGNVRLLNAPDASPLVTALTELLLLSYGPLAVLTTLLSDVEGIDEAFIYGSWAARHAGVLGPLPNDVDVAVIGSASLERLDEVARLAQSRLRRPVDIRRISTELWNDPTADTPFVVSLRERPRVRLSLRG